MSPTPPEAPAPLDVRSLTGPVDAAAVAAQAQRLERETGVRARTSRVGVGCAVVLVVVVGAPTAALFAVLSVGHGPGWAVAAAVVAVATVALCVRVLRAASREDRTAPVQRYRLERFAADNGLDYVAEVADPPHLREIFPGGRDRVARDVVRWPDGALEVAGFSSVTEGYRGIRSVWQRGYATARLDGASPDLRLDVKKGSGLLDGRLSARFDMRTPAHLSAPDGARGDLRAHPRDVDAARRVVDEPLLSRLAARGVDLEIVDGRMLLSSERPMSTTDPGTWTWVVGTVQAVRDRVASL